MLWYKSEAFFDFPKLLTSCEHTRYNNIYFFHKRKNEIICRPNWRRSPDDRKKTQTAVVWSCFSFIRSSQNHLARLSERGKKTRQTEEEVGRQHQGIDRPEVQQVTEGSREQVENGENWLHNHLWCPNGPHG